MLSFLLSLGHRAAKNAHTQRAQITKALVARSWASEAPSEPSEPGGYALYASGPRHMVQRGQRWHLLRAPLYRRALSDAERAMLCETHAALQNVGPAGAQSIVQKRLRELEEPAVWVAWSETDRCVLAFRDPLGRVPLYLYEGDGGTMLTNTRRAIEPWVSQAPIRSSRAIASHLLWGTPPSNRESLFRGLDRVAPGTMVAWRERTAPTHRRWWNWRPPALIAPKEAEDAARHYRTLVQGAVLRAPLSKTVAFELSGGMDSTGLLAAYRTRMPHGTLHAFNFAADEGDEDRQLAARLAASFHVDFHTLPPAEHADTGAPSPGTGGLIAHTAGLLTQLGDPVDVFSGHGGDNLFRVRRDDIDRIRAELGVATWLRLLRMHRRAHRSMPPLFIRERWGQNNPQAQVRAHGYPWLRDPVSDAVREIIVNGLDFESAPNGRAHMFSHPRWSGIFEMTDAGFHGRPVQYHFPYFDLDLIRFVAQLPAVPWLYDKYLARNAWAGTLPRAITQRAKTGYSFRSSPARTQTLRAPKIAKTALPDWIDSASLAQWRRDPTRFPHWTHPNARAVIGLLQWAETDPNRLRLP